MVAMPPFSVSFHGPPGGDSLTMGTGQTEPPFPCMGCSSPISSCGTSSFEASTEPASLLLDFFHC